MILHIVIDDKFVDKGLSSFEAAYPGGNRVLMITKNEQFEYLKMKPDMTIKPSDLLNRKIIEYIRSFNAIVLHTLNGMSSFVSLLSRKSTKILWIGWGYDYYELLIIKGYCLYGVKTKILLKQMEEKRRGTLKRILTNFLFNLVILISLRRIDYFSPVTYEDYELFRNYYPKLKMKYLPWNYGKLANPSPVYLVQKLGRNILLGNSASFTNNHLEAFDILSRIDLRGRKIIVPLSYGDKKYGDEISRIGKSMFGDAFVPVREFMDSAKYLELLKTCSVAVMNHKRQQAAGNLNTMIELGAKVYMDTHNPLYKTYKSLKIEVFPMNELIDPATCNMETELSSEQKESNWKNLRSMFSEEKIKIRTRNIVNILC